MNFSRKLLCDISTKSKIMNRYGLISKSDNNMKAYFFSVPILSQTTKKIVNSKIEKRDGVYYYNGSNCEVKIYNDRIMLCKGKEIIFLHFNAQKNIVLSEDGSYLKAEDIIFFPTFNGIIIKQRGNKAKIKMESTTQKDVKNNSKNFAFMQSKFEPVVTFNAMFAENRYRDTFYNIMLHSNKITDNLYELELIASNENAFQLTYDINMYEPKLIQDTTVESKNPCENNAYGNISFLGKSSCLGIQFLYSRVDMEKMDLPTNIQILNVKIHIPYYTINGNDFRISVPVKRFCSFGSNWNNKIPYSNDVLLGIRNNGYITFDISKYVISKTGKWNPNEGFVIKSQGEHFSIIGTGDNYYTPQIIEITFKNKEKNNNEI